MSTALLPEMQRLVDRLLAFLAQDGCTDAEFDALAAALFSFQYENDAAYRRFCQRRGIMPRRVAGWRDIPPVPISAFGGSRRLDTVMRSPSRHAPLPFRAVNSSPRATFSTTAALSTPLRATPIEVAYSG